MNRVSSRHLAVLTLSLLLLLGGATRLDAAKTSWLGIYMQDVTRELAEAFNLPATHGVLINEVLADSPAEKAGLKQGDVILSFNGKEVDDAGDLADLVREARPGDDVQLLVATDGKEKDFTVQIGEREEPSWYSRRGRDYKLQDMLSNKTHGLGVSLQSLSGDLYKYFGVPEDEGALITEVFEDSPAEKAGLKVGDVILKVDGEAVEGPTDVSYAVGEHKIGDQVDLTIVRDRNQQQLTVTVDEYESPYASGLSGMRWLPDTPTLNQFHSVPYHYWFNRDDVPDNEELESQMEQLQRELKELQKNLKELEDRLD